MNQNNAFETVRAALAGAHKNLKRLQNPLPPDSASAHRSLFRISRLLHYIEGENAACEKFAAEFTADPIHALKWAENTVHSAACVSITAPFLPALTAAVSVEEVEGIIGRMVQHLSKRLLTNNFDTRSTSVMSNLVGDATRVACSRSYEMLSEI